MSFEQNRSRKPLISNRNDVAGANVTRVIVNPESWYAGQIGPNQVQLGVFFLFFVVRLHRFFEILNSFADAFTHFGQSLCAKQDENDEGKDQKFRYAEIKHLKPPDLERPASITESHQGRPEN
jgi:hypothetical protein